MTISALICLIGSAVCIGRSIEHHLFLTRLRRITDRYEKRPGDSESFVKNYSIKPTMTIKYFKQAELSDECDLTGGSM